MTTNLDQYDAVLLDLDGTIYHEEHALPGAVELLWRLQREGRRFACLTNSTSSPKRLAERLKRMGVVLPEEVIYTAGVAAVDYVLAMGGDSVGPALTPEKKGWHGRLARAFAFKKRGRDAHATQEFVGSAKADPTKKARPAVFNLSTEGVAELLEGKVTWVEDVEAACDVVLVGTPTSAFATEARQRMALEILRRDRAVKLVGICADRVYPSPRGIEFGSGSLTMMLAYAANVTPIFTGKPEAIFFQELCGRLGVAPAKCLLIGDNLESDIAGGKSVGMKTILVLTGVARREDVDRFPVEKRPDAVIEDLRAL